MYPKKLVIKGMGFTLSSASQGKAVMSFLVWFKTSPDQKIFKLG